MGIQSSTCGLTIQLYSDHEGSDVCCSHRWCCCADKCSRSSTTGSSSTPTSSLPPKTTCIRRLWSSSLWTTISWWRWRSGRPSPTFTAWQEWRFRLNERSPPLAVVKRWPRREGWEREGWDQFSATSPAARQELQGCSRLCEAEHWHHFVWKEFGGQPECQEMLCMHWWTFRYMIHLTLVLSGFPMRRLKYTL